MFLVTGVFAGATSFAFAPGFIVAVGASGAIFGLVGAFIAYNYRRREHMMAQATTSRARCACSSINLIIGFSIPGIDWRAHVGGLVAGLVAGFAVDPSRPVATRRAFAAAGGLVALLVVAIALVAFRTRPDQTRTRRSCCRLTRRPHEAVSTLPAFREPVEVALARPEVDPTPPDRRRRLDAVVEVQLPEQHRIRFGLRHVPCPEVARAVALDQDAVHHDRRPDRRRAHLPLPADVAGVPFHGQHAARGGREVHEIAVERRRRPAAARALEADLPGVDRPHQRVLGRDGSSFISWPTSLLRSPNRWYSLAT